MSDETRADYDELENVSQRFANQAQEVEEIFTKISTTMENLRDGWIGRGSDAFFSEMESDIIPATNRLRDVLSDASDLTKEIASKLQGAEEEASSRFRNLA
jgi:WXG100 family type VII secretion target